MALTASEAWDRILAVAKRDIPEQTFRTWLEPLTAVEFSGSSIVLSAPDQFSADWNESKLSGVLQGMAPMALGHPCAFAFQVDPKLHARVQMDLFAKATSPHSTSLPGRSIVRPQLSARYTFDQFVIGKSNELAAAAALAVADAPGRVYNPLFIYGATGLGKTHLIQAIAHQILISSLGSRVIYVGAEQFTNDYIGAIQGRTTADFRRRYRETDVLLIDDVHFLRNKEATQEEFFHTFNALYESGRQILLTSDRPPAEIPAVESRLVSRFQWGMVADIEPPDLEHRIAILQKKAETDQLQRTIPPDVIYFLAETITSSVRELEGAIVRLLAFASLKGRQISIALAAEALLTKGLTLHDQTIHQRTASVTVEAIQLAVGKIWGVSIEALQSKSRMREVAIPRQAAMWLCRDLLKLQLTQIGGCFGGRDHSTVIHSLERALELKTSDLLFSERLEKTRYLILHPV
jgi:chromosomal replication initiator protein